MPPSSSDTDINLDSEVEENPEWQDRSVGENQGKWRQAIGIGLALVAILAILIRIAAPSMQDMIVNGRLQGASSDLAADLALARGGKDNITAILVEID